MKKRILLTLVMALALSLVLALSIFADDTSVHNGKVDLDAKVILDDGTECALFDSEGNALIWYKSGSEYFSIRADDSRVKYKATYSFGVGNSTVGTATAYEVSDMWIALESGKVSKGNIVVLNLMDDDVKVNEATNNGYLGGPVNCVKTIQWANKILEYAYLRLDTVAIQQSAFNGCTKLKYVNLEDLTELRQIGGGSSFANNPAFMVDQTLDLTATKLTSLGGSGAFNATPIGGLKLPSTCTYIEEWALQNTRLVSFAFPENATVIKGSEFNDTKTLVEIYINKNTTTINDRAFNNTSLERIFFVGSLAELNTLLDNTGINNNAPVWNVVGSSRENIISYADYLALEDKNGSFVVYGYSYCEAYKDGAHALTGNAVMQAVDYFGPVKFADTCTVEGCGMNVVDETKTISALFVDYGYSATEAPINGTYSMSQFYGINRDALAQYREISTDFEFGFVVAADADPFGSVANGTLAEDKIFVTEEKFFAYDYVSVSIGGITSETADKAVTFCMFVKDGDGVYYLDGGKTVDTVAIKSYNDILSQAK